MTTPPPQLIKNPRTGRWIRQGRNRRTVCHALGGTIPSALTTTTFPVGAPALVQAGATDSTNGYIVLRTPTSVDGVAEVKFPEISMTYMDAAQITVQGMTLSTDDYHKVGVQLGFRPSTGILAGVKLEQNGVTDGSMYYRTFAASPDQTLAHHKMMGQSATNARNMGLLVRGTAKRAWAMNAKNMDDRDYDQPIDAGWDMSSTNFLTGPVWPYLRIVNLDGGGPYDLRFLQISLDVWTPYGKP